MKKQTAKKSPAKKAAPKSKQSKKSARKAKAKAKPAKRVAAKKPAKKPAKKAAPTSKRKAAPAKNWRTFVERHGVVLASAKGPVPNVAEAIAGEPIVGSWWSHPKGQQIFDSLSDLDDDEDIRCFKLVDHKITFVHRRLWPALAKLAQAGVLEADRVASIQQEHMPTGEHRNIVTPFPDWVPEEALARAEQLSIDDAKQQLGTWI